MRSRAAPSKRHLLYLVNPRLVHKHYGAGQELAYLLGKKKIGVPLALPLVAALTPSHWQVRIIDDETDAFPEGERPDLVALTTSVSCIRRAYEIADHFRKQAVPVVLGGTYASFQTDEALEHADAVVVGEAEGSWPALLADFERGALQRVYRKAAPSELTGLPRPRWDLIDTSEVITVGVETSRGCPYHCEFCLVTKVFGRKMRYRDLDEVVRELEGLPTRSVFFVDDNLTINKPRARALMARLEPLGLTWVCQCSIDVADDEELLDAMARAGCFSILIGFESLDPRALVETHKLHNRVEEYGAAIARIHARGIHVIASFVVGFDADTPTAFDAIARFVDDNDLLLVMLSVLAAAPGTDIWERMKQQRRLVYATTDFVNGTLPCMQYRHFSQVGMLEHYVQTLERIFDPEAVLRRAQRLFARGSFRTPSSGRVALRDKLAASALVAERYLLGGGVAKRRLLSELVRQARTGIVAMDRVIVLLIQMEANFAFLRTFRQELGSLRERIAAIDPGPVPDVTGAPRSPAARQ